MTYAMTKGELHTARDVLGYYGLEGGYEPGGFTKKLIALLEIADPQNTRKLLEAFPGFRPAFEIMTTEGGEALVQAVKDNAK